MVAGVGDIMPRVTPLNMAARATTDPEVVRVMDFLDRWQADGFREILEVLVTKAPLRQDVTVERATQLLLLFVGEDVYHVLVETHGWTQEAWVEWTVATVAGLVVAPVPPE